MFHSTYFYIFYSDIIRHYPIMKRKVYSKSTSFPLNNFSKKKWNKIRFTQLYTPLPYYFTLRTDWFRYPPSALEPHRKWLVKTAEWHCVCRYIRWALVFHYGDAAVTRLVKPIPCVSATPWISKDYNLQNYLISRSFHCATEPATALLVF